MSCYYWLVWSRRLLSYPWLKLCPWNLRQWLPDTQCHCASLSGRPASLWLRRINLWALHRQREISKIYVFQQINVIVSICWYFFSSIFYWLKFKFKDTWKYGNYYHKWDLKCTDSNWYESILYNTYNYQSNLYIKYTKSFVSLPNSFLFWLPSLPFPRPGYELGPLLFHPILPPDLAPWVLDLNGGQMHLIAKPNLADLVKTFSPHNLYIYIYIYIYILFCQSN